MELTLAALDQLPKLIPDGDSFRVVNFQSLYRNGICSALQALCHSPAPEAYLPLLLAHAPLEASHLSFTAGLAPADWPQTLRRLEGWE